MIDNPLFVLTCMVFQAVSEVSKVKRMMRNPEVVVLEVEKIPRITTKNELESDSKKIVVLAFRKIREANLIDQSKEG
jgi:hypothetical protein